MTTVLRNPTATIILGGEIDLATCPAVRRALMAAIGAGNTRLTVDMSAVAFIDAGGIGMLLAAANAAMMAGGGLSLLSPSPAVRRVLDALEVNGHLPVVY